MYLWKPARILPKKKAEARADSSPDPSSARARPHSAPRHNSPRKIEAGCGQDFRSKKVRAKCIITAPNVTCSELTAPRGEYAALRRAKSAFVFAVKSQSSPQ